MYRAVMLQGMGGLDRLEEVAVPFVEPGPGEVRVRVVAAGAGSTDILMRTSKYLFAPDFPFVPGYELVGVIDAVGGGVTGLAVGQKVAALTVHGAFAEYLVRSADDFVPVPAGLDDAQTVALILNYVTAYQIIHRSASMREDSLLDFERPRSSLRRARCRTDDLDSPAAELSGEDPAAAGPAQLP